MRERGDLGRQTLRGQRLGNVAFPESGTLQPGAEAVGLAELEADVVGGLPQPGRVGVRPQLAHALFLGVLGCRAGAEPAQDLLVALAGRRNLLLARARGRGGVKVQRLVDDRQIALVVDEARIGGNLAVDPHPEVDVRLQGGRLGDGGRGARAQHGK